MFIEEHNDDKITKDSCELFTTRVKVFIINSHNEIIVAESNGGCQLPGGHVEEGETLNEAIMREVQEECGISILEKEISDPFYEIRFFYKDYHGTGKNRFSNVVYSIIQTDESPNLHNIQLTENEKKNSFKVKKVNMKDFEEYVNFFVGEKQKEINNAIARDVLSALAEFKKVYGKLNNSNEL